ncbi:MAG TPA: class I SAM-dependent methyltransferase [Pseudonocardia sp.]
MIADDDATPMDVEFDLLAEWTRQAVRQLGEEHALPAACQGSASPAALDWLAHACDLTEGTGLLDVGGGTGGPAAYAADRFGARPLLVDPMPGACGYARSLFGLSAVVGTGEALPVATGALDVAWCLGVLCTTAHRVPVLAELRRVLRAGGSVGLLVFVKQTAEVPDAPAGNDFPDSAELERQISAAGLVFMDRTRLDALQAAPASWTARADRVQEAVAREHAGDPRYREAEDQKQRLGRLLRDAVIAGELVHARAPA